MSTKQMPPRKPWEDKTPEALPTTEAELLAAKAAAIEALYTSEVWVAEWMEATKRVAAAAERELGKPELHQVRCNFCQEVLGYVYSIGKPGGGICQDCTKTARELGMLP